MTMTNEHISHVYLRQYYESWSFLRDQEKNSMLPMMARGKF